MAIGILKRSLVISEVGVDSCQKPPVYWTIVNLADQHASLGHRYAHCPLASLTDRRSAVEDVRKYSGQFMRTDL